VKYKILSSKEKGEDAVLDIPHKGRSSELVFLWVTGQTRRNKKQQMLVSYSV